MATRYLITSALPYINGVKHLGNLVGSMLPADVYARYLRSQGREVLYVCGTDEHGTPAELAALEAGLDVAEYCRQQHEVQADLGRRFHLSFDHFGRSSSTQNRELTLHIAARLQEGGYLDERSTRQAYSVDDQRFLPDRYVTGTCPHCGYEAARGDQCDSCTRVLDPAELINPRSTVSGSNRIEFRETRHLFLLLPKLADEVRAWIDSHEAEWSTITISTARKWLNEGLQDRCITRDLKWGIPVGRAGFEDKVFYVWFDAPIEYLGATAAWAEQKPAERNYRDWWWQQSPESVRYTQFMAKDNLPFHTIMFPAMIIGTREPWKLPDYVKGFNWLTYEGGKFSTSLHRGVFMNDALDLLPADCWRYALLLNCPESSDSDFSFDVLAQSINKGLADKFGNFINRSLKFCSTRFGDTVPGAGEWTALEDGLVEELERRVAAYGTYLEELQYRKALQELTAIWTAANVYFENAAPWSSMKPAVVDQGGRERAECTLRMAINVIRLFAIVSEPVIPETAGVLCTALNLTPEERTWVKRPMAEELRVMTAGRPFTVPPVLFRKITDEEVVEWKAKFAGSGAGAE